MVDINMCSNVNGCTTNDDFYLQVTNYGLYVARFSGYYETPDHYVEFKSNDLYIGQFQRINFPKNTKNLVFKIENLYFIGIWIPFYNDSYYLPRKNICISCTGVSFLPDAREVPCTNSLDLMQKQGLQLQNDFLLNCYYKNLMSLQPPQLLNNNCNMAPNTTNRHNYL